MDLLQVALDRFEQLAPAVRAGMTSELSDNLEAWMRGPVCGVAVHLFHNSRFRGFARWSVDHLARGSNTSERRAVEAVDRALVAAASETAAVGDSGLNAPSGAEEPRITWLSGRPWFDLVATEDFFDCGAGLMVVPSRRDLWGKFFRSPDPRVPLGDYVARAMFRRVELLAGLVSDAWEPAFRAASRPGPDGEVGAWERLFVAKTNLDQAIAALTTECHQGDDARLRDACCTLVQVVAGYAPNPDLEWLGGPGLRSQVVPAIIRSHVRPPGEVTLVEQISAEWGQAVGSERTPLCLPEMVMGVAGALTEVERLYRRPALAEDLIDWLRRERRLVLVDRRPREAYWDGHKIDADWDRNPKLWDLMWILTRRARQRRHVDREELTHLGDKGSAVKNRRSRLSDLIPGPLDNLIDTASPGGYQLVLDPALIALVQLDDDLRPIEVGEDEMPNPATGFPGGLAAQIRNRH